MHITVYSTSTCSNCVRLKGYLSDEGYDYTEINLSEQRDKMAELQAIAPGTTSVPVVVIDREDGSDLQVIHGYDESVLTVALQS